jgi:malate dehydrogenase (oxaloacetate-decarboxylating)(NADP+)
MSDYKIANGECGVDVLHDPTVNKSTGYTEAERQALGLVGLVPDVTESIENQLDRVLLQLKNKATDLDRFIYLINLLDANEGAPAWPRTSCPTRTNSRPANLSIISTWRASAHNESA